MSQTESGNGETDESNGSEPPPVVEHDVTRPNTVKHWALYTLDAIEAKWSDMEGEMNPRKSGAPAERVYEFAAGDESIVFRSQREVSSALSEMSEGQAPFYEPENRVVNRRTDATDWDGPDVVYRYRLTDFGRRVLLDLGVPEKLPNRREEDYDRSLGGVRPAHEPGWWGGDYEYYDSEWDIADSDWVETDYDRVFYRTEEAKVVFGSRGYTTLAADVADAFPEVTFVLTVGPHRSYDVKYVIRDPWRFVVQLDFYSPMLLHRRDEHVHEVVTALVEDLHEAMESVGPEDDD